jgi:hypothetical protein
MLKTVTNSPCHVHDHTLITEKHQIFIGYVFENTNISTDDKSVANRTFHGTAVCLINHEKKRKNCFVCETL